MLLYNLDKKSFGTSSPSLMPRLFRRKSAKDIFFTTPSLCKSVFNMMVEKHNTNKAWADFKQPTSLLVVLAVLVVVVVVVVGK